MVRESEREGYAGMPSPLFAFIFKIIILGPHWRDLSSLSWDGTCVPCSGSPGVLTTGTLGKSLECAPPHPHHTHSDEDLSPTVF